MENIKDVQGYTMSGKFDIDASVKADNDSTESKRVTLRFNMNSVPLIDIVTPALRSKRIDWQRMARTKFNSIADKSVIEVEFASPGKRVVTREEMINEYTVAFRKAGLPEAKAHELATKAVDNPEVLA